MSSNEPTNQALPARDDASPGSSEASLVRHRDMIARARQQVATLSDANSSGASSARSRPPEDLVEGYELLNELHRGGQGVVYRALQRSTNRHVAIKLLVHGAFASASERLRFEREAELLARLDVPGIVRIVDSGVSSGRWWFAMDLIDGVALDRVPRERRAVIELIAKVAEAVHAAHLRGVIHRDLKPQNILVDQRGQPHVLDFGLAHEAPVVDAGRDGTTPGESDSRTITEPGQFVGSLPWASPEQVGNRPEGIDLRTDIYSLGVLLFQLLTDRFPYRVVGPLHEITRAITGDEPIAPSSIDPSIDRDLETIVLACLRKDPARRYQSAALLAEDLTSYLRGEPLAARRDSLAYVARLWIARHRLASALVAIGLVVVVTTAIVTTALWRSATRAQARAESASRASATALGFLERIIGSADPGSTGGRPLNVTELMDQARRELEAGAVRQDPEVEATIRYSVAHVLRQLGRFDEAAELAEASLGLRERSLADPHVDTGRSFLLLSTIRRRQGRAQEAMELGERGLATIRAAHGGEDHVDIAAALVELAWSISATGEPTKAEAMLSEAIAMFERLLAPDDERLLIARLNRMLLAHHSTTLEEARTLVGQLEAKLGPRHESTIAGTKLVAALEAGSGDATGAIRSMRRALDATRAIYGERHPLAIDTLITLSGLVRRVDGENAAYELLSPGRENARAAYGEASSGWGQFQLELASLALAAGEADAADLYRGSLATFAAAGLPIDPNQARALIELAVLSYRTGSQEDVERLTHECLDAPDAALPGDHWTRAQATALLGRLRLDQRRYAEAERLLLDADRMLRLAPSRNGHIIASNERTLLELYEAWQKAEPASDRSTDIARWRSSQQPVQPPS
jgi:tetratricopeptide (TPR) repeat protein